MPQLGLTNSVDTLEYPDPFKDTHSVHFDGGDEHLQTSYEIALASRMYSFWARTDETGYNSAVFGYGGRYQGSFGINKASNRPAVGLKNTINRVWEDVTAQDDDAWHHWALWMDVATIGNSELYLDGVLQTEYSVEDTGTATAWATGLSIGTDGRDWMEDLINDFAVFDTELPIAAVQAIYNAGKPFNLLYNKGAYDQYTDNLVAYWRMGDGEGDTFPLIVDQVNTTVDTTEELGTADNDWDTSVSAWSISSGVLSYDASASQYMDHVGTTIGNFPLVKWAVYKLVFTITSTGTGKIQIRDHNGATLVASADYANGTHTVYIQEITNTGARFTFYGQSTGDAFDLTSYSIKKVNGYPGLLNNNTSNDIMTEVP